MVKLFGWLGFLSYEYTDPPPTLHGKLLPSAFRGELSRAPGSKGWGVAMIMWLAAMLGRSIAAAMTMERMLYMVYMLNELGLTFGVLGKIVVLIFFVPDEGGLDVVRIESVLYVATIVELDCSGRYISD